MSMASEYDDTVKRHSGWLVPIAVFVVTAALSALFLLYYLAPAPTSFIEERPLPTDASDPVSLSVNGLDLTIPGNYIKFKSVRQGGARREIALFASFPDFHGYSGWDSGTFSNNSADSPLIEMLIRQESLHLGEADRLKRIYLNYVVDPKGEAGPFGLTQFTFRDDSGYRGEDLFVGQMNGKPIVMRCVRFSQNVANPSCLRDVRLTKGAALSYRFKRALLSRWQDIATGVETLAQSFRHPKS
ncbi:MAG: hypothetical protein HY243_17330 [Proteobacteria bacterium]|nr:hypothetical protein [Pseudomonadota bacterium]